MLRVKRMSLWGAVGLSVGVLAGAGVARAQGQPAPAPTTVEVPVRPVVMTDAAITDNIKTRLDKSPLIRRAQIKIATQNGVVTLAGSVPNDFARDEVLETARTTPGVVRIDDQLRLDVSSPSAPARNP